MAVLLVLACCANANDNKLGDRSQISGGEVEQHLQDPGLNVRGMIPVTTQANELQQPVTEPAGAIDTIERPQPQSQQPPQHQFSSLSGEQRQMAATAWGYFEQQYQPQTGLINSVAGYREVTLWDVASIVAGTVAAYELELITAKAFTQRLERLLDTLATMPLYRHRLPNRGYYTDSGKPVVTKKNQQYNGSGWSVLDIARTLGWLVILQQRHPQFEPQIDEIRTRWSTEWLVNDGELQGARMTSGGERRYQEGRVGYEQYAAIALTLWGLTADKALLRQTTQRISIGAVSVPKDQRPRPFFTSDPFYLAQLEFGIRAEPMRFDAQALYLAHRQHYQQTGELRCFGEDAIAWKPWFLYNNLHYSGSPWHSTDYLGRASEQSQWFSVKCAVAFAVLANDAFAEALWQQARLLHTKQGWVTGLMADDRRNHSRNLNTNAVILTALLYVENGNQGLLSTVP